MDHLSINEKIQRHKQSASGQITTALLHPRYDVDFSSKIFGQIRMRKLLNSTPPEYIKKFFKDFDHIKNIVITVKDVENPSLDKKSLIVLEL